jgi:hypothetical protein
MFGNMTKSSNPGSPLQQALDRTADASLPPQPTLPYRQQLEIYGKDSLCPDHRLLGPLAAPPASIKGTLNMRELPVPLQLPDWNDWLPEVHPIDMWGTSFNNSKAITTYQQMRQQLASAPTGGALLDTIETVLIDGWDSVFTYMSGPQPCLGYLQDRAAGTAEPQLMDQLPIAAQDMTVGFYLL